ncbi:MAG: wax ester/triacylglycerol synthase family O-acyltransferase [Acidimicrobiia bacterium]
MSDSDALMWNIEKDPLLRSTIVTVGLLDRSPDWGRFVDKIDRGSRQIPRLRQRVVTPPLRIGPPHWSADEHFDLEYHLRRVRAPEPATVDTVLDIARNAAMASFDRARPLWEYLLVDGLEDGRAAVVMKVHHSMTDGVGGMKLAMMLLDVERDQVETAPMPPPSDLDVISRADVVRRSLAHQVRRGEGMVVRGLRGVAEATRDLTMHPIESAEHAAVVARSVAKMLEPAMSPRSPIMRERTLARQLATLEVPLDDLKRAAKAVGGTLNDAFLGGVLGGLARYHRVYGAEIEDLRMTMPINVRSHESPMGGNHFTPARFLVPMTIGDPAERMVAIKELVARVREEPSVRLTDALASVLNQLPTSVTTALFGAMLKGADFVASNVPGAPFPVFVAGAEMTHLFPFGPLSGSAANVTLLSHAGICCIGVNVDAVAVPEMEVFMESLDHGFAGVLGVV